MKARIIAILSTVSTVLISSMAVASAHVVVTPKTAQTAQETLFTISVPDEKQVAMTQLKLTVPAGVREVTPTALAGWTVSTEKSGDNVSAITWSGGQLPAGQRQDFTFQAQTPETAGSVAWKAYQTFADGSTTSWDQKPTANEADDDSAANGPYSLTTVSDKASAMSTSTSSQNSAVTSAALGVSLLALVLSVFSLVRRPAAHP